MKTVDILAIGAHMGDEVAWGMILAAHKRQGMSIGMLHLTPGEKGHKTLPAAEYAAQKRLEAADCARVLDAETWTLPYGDGELPVNDEVQWGIADVLREARPSRIITHWSGSIHKDHAAAHHNLPNARFYAGLPAFPRTNPAFWVPLVYYGENWEDLTGYEPEVYIKILPEDIDAWEHAMKCYALFRGEVASFPYLDYYKALARSRGCEAGFEYAATLSAPKDQRRRVVESLV